MGWVGEGHLRSSESFINLQVVMVVKQLVEFDSNDNLENLVWVHYINQPYHSWADFLLLEHLIHWRFQQKYEQLEEDY